MRRLPLRSPPRMRGKGGWKVSASVLCGIIPACAGKRAASAREAYFIWDHPRVCGEKSAFTITGTCDPGSPPRMRGKGRFLPGDALRVGITPAYAGKRKLPLGVTWHTGDHPRVCGEKWFWLSTMSRVAGSPPRMRGKACSPCSSCNFHGITPAYAGKSRKKEQRWRF